MTVELKSRRLRLAVLVSGGGRSLENLVERSRDGRCEAEVVTVVSSSGSAGALARCTRLGIAAVVIERNEFESDVLFSDAVFDHVRGARADLVVMAGFLKLLVIPDDFARRVINIHPALLPRHGGVGMYGDRVHAAVLAAGEGQSGCSVHFADNEYDHGPMILQMTCSVLPDDTPDTLADRVFELEKEALPCAISMMAAGEVGPMARRKTNS